MNTVEESVEKENRIIAEFMGYNFYEEKVMYDISDYEYKNYQPVSLYSKTPILFEVDSEVKWLLQVPNPDYQNEVNPKWNKEYKTLHWETLNPDHFIEAKYHSSWDWLMPVWNKFKELHIKGITDKHYHKQVCASFGKGILRGDIKEAFADAVMAIKWSLMPLDCTMHGSFRYFDDKTSTTRCSECKGIIDEAAAPQLTKGRGYEEVASASKGNDGWDNYFDHIDGMKAALANGKTAPVSDGWISVDERLPDESHGRVLCWVNEQNDLGLSSFFWNCSYSKLHGFTDNRFTYHVTHWQEVKPPQAAATPAPIASDGEANTSEIWDSIDKILHNSMSQGVDAGTITAYLKSKFSITKK